MLQENNPLYYLIKIDSYQSISLAAENLHSSQPALSQAMKNLEKSLNLTLLNRTYRGVSLTEDGKKVVELAKKAFDYFEEIENISRQKSSPKQMDVNINDLIIYTNPAYSMWLLSSLVKDYNSNQNQNTLQFQNLSQTTNALTAIEQNIDAVILDMIKEKTAYPSHEKIFILNKSKSYVMCAKNFSYIPQNKTSVSFQELIKIPLVINKNSFEFQDTLLGILKLHGQPLIKAVAPDYYSISYMIESGLGVTFTNKLINTADFNNFRLIPIRNAPSFLLVLIYNKGADQQKIAKLADLLKNSI